MIYRVIEHYQDDYPNIDYSFSLKLFVKSYFLCGNENIPSECMICYEIIDYPCKLSELSYFKMCGCDGNVHKICLDKWFSYGVRCPVCRTRMTIAENKYTVKLISDSMITVDVFLNIVKYLYLYFILHIFYSTVSLIFIKVFNTNSMYHN